MRQLFLIIVSIIFFRTISFGQELVMVKDTINKFQIGVPVGWRYGIPEDSSAMFMAIREKDNENDNPREVVRINIFHHEETDLNKEYKNFIKSIRQRDGFKIIEQKDKIINDRNYKYLIENHKNAINKENTADIILLADNNGEILMLTMATSCIYFDRYFLLFNRIAESLKY